MTHVNLDTQPEVVRQFVLALSAAPEGTVLESGGRPVACIIAPPMPANGPVERVGEWTEEKNRRRCELIDRKYDHGLTSPEEAELALLQDAMYRHVDRVAPLPLEAARNLHQELLEKVSRARRKQHMTLPFIYPPVPHVRRHGPRGYADHESYRPWLRDEFAFRCVYRLVREIWGLFKGVYALDHFLAVSARPDLAQEYDNLLYACVSCNLSKGSQQTPDPLSCLIDPDVFVTDDGTIHANNLEGRKLLDLLGLNRPRLREFRAMWIRIVHLAKLADPELFHHLMGFPADLPDLSALAPPGANTRPNGITQSHFARRQRGELPEIY